MKLLDSGIIPFYTAFPDMVAARRIFDHVPIWAETNFVTAKVAKAAKYHKVIFTEVTKKSRSCTEK